MKKIYLLAFATISSLTINAQLVESTTTEKWENSAWENLSKLSNTYNANNQTSEILYQNWLTGAWINIGNSVYSYNSDGNISELTSQVWAGGSWLNSMNSTYTYNSDNLLEVILTQNVFGGTTNSERLTYTYDSNGNNIELQTESWQTGAGTWFVTSKTVNSFNSDNLLTQFTNYNYSTSPTSTSKTTLTYNSDGNVSETISQNLNAGNWVNTAKGIHQYNTSNQAGVHSSYTWENGSWELSTQATPSYNSSGLLYQTLYQLADINTGVLENQLRTTVLYNNIGLDENLISDINIYPNPTSDIINIDLKQDGLSYISVSNMEGKKMFTATSFLDKQTIDLSKFPSGIYTIQIIKDGKVNTFQALRK